MGVKRAVEMAMGAPDKYQNPIFTYGPLIHNPHVLDVLKKKGVTIINEVPARGFGTVLIRAHGIPPEAKNGLAGAGFTVIDATCPRVIKVQRIISKHRKEGYASIIIGDKNHPEVVGLLAYSGNMGYVVSDFKELVDLPYFKKAIIVSQTTQNTHFFQKAKNWAASHFPHYLIFDTICNSTQKRQSEVKRLSEVADSILVVGGHNSGNTRRLAEIARQSGKPVFHIESEAELDSDAIGSSKTIGITAGASTPDWIIKRVCLAIEKSA